MTDETTDPATPEGETGGAEGQEVGVGSQPRRLRPWPKTEVSPSWPTEEEPPASSAPAKTKSPENLRLVALNSGTLAEAALDYKERGWGVVCLSADGRLPASLAGRTIEKVQELWRDHPDKNVGIRTGAAFGIVGIHFRLVGGSRTFREVTEELGPFETLGGAAVDGGRFFLFRAPVEQLPSRRDIFPGVDFHGEEGCLAAPPSVVGSEKATWYVRPNSATEPAELPEWLLSLVEGRTTWELPPQERSGVDPSAVTAPPPARTGHRQEARQSSGAPPQQTKQESLAYARRGWLVFPLKTGGKKPLTENGLHAATLDPAKISQWWTRRPSANVGVRTGAESGVVVVDVDTKNDQPGLQSLAELEAQHGRLGTLRARTPTGGLHLFFRAPGQKLGNRTGFLPGLDFRGDGGYVVAAPSKVGGREYRWEDPAAEVAELPEWLLALLTSRTQKARGSGPAPRESLSFSEALAGVMEGTRNDTVFRFACKLRQEGWEYDEARVLVLVAADRCQPPLPEDEALRCLDGAWRYEPPAALSDLGNAERFVARCGDQVRFEPEKERWLVWSGHWWEANLRALFRMAKGTVRSLRDEAAAETDPKKQHLLFRHARRSENAESIERMLELASLELAVRAEDLDRPGLVAFADGVLDLSSGELRPGRREDLLTKHAPFPYVPGDPECLRRLANRGKPSSARASAGASESWAERFDRWLPERCEVGPEFSEKASVLLADFSRWAGEKVSPRRFGELLAAKGFGHRKSSVYFWDGLRLRG